MNYLALLQKLFQLNLLGGMKLGLQNAVSLQKALDFPDHSFPSVHVAGTNGKGSVCWKIARALQLSGRKVGLYTSPHISSFRERIQVDGVYISEDQVKDGLEKIFFILDTLQIPATFFEVTTSLAFWHFARSSIDVAVVETGLGGRLDATNIISPLLSIITSIALDHTEILGETLEKIALEKSGIIKPNVPVLLGPRASLDSIQEIARKQHSPCFCIPYSSEITYDAENSKIAKEALQLLSSSFPDLASKIDRALSVKPPCRFEKVSTSPEIFLDAAHNPDGLKALHKELAQLSNPKPCRFVVGLSKTKDVKSCLDYLVQMGSSFHLVEARNGRGVSVEQLKRDLEQITAAPLFHRHSSIDQAVQEAKEKARQNDERLVICGTFFILGEARDSLGLDYPSDPFDLNERNAIHYPLASQLGGHEGGHAGSQGGGHFGGQRL